MDWKEISKRIDNEIAIGTEIPKTTRGSRSVTRIVGERIYMRTGVETDAEKYVTKEMIRFAYENLERGFDSHMLKQRFPKEFSQGPCVFSMTGGILEKLGLAKCIRVGNRFVYVSTKRS